MRIGIEAQRIFRRKKHGMDVVAIELIRNLQALDNKNDYIIFSRKGINDNTVAGSGNFQLVQSNSFTYVDWEQISLPAAIGTHKIDVLHCTANTAPLRKSVPTILTLHDIIYLESVDFKGTPYQNLGNLYRRWLVPKIADRVDVILTVSEFERNNILERMKLPEEKVKVLYNGVSSRFNNKCTEEEVNAVKRAYKLPKDYMMFLGNTAPKKNTTNVIKAYIELCLEKRDVISLVLLDYKKELIEKLLKEIGQPQLISKFIFPGYIPHDKIPLVYSGAAVFLYPSLRESFGLPILEAMACGVPVITSKTSSMPEVAGNAALLVDPFDYKKIKEGMSSLLSNDTLRRELKELGLRRSEQFTWRASAEQLIGIYESFK